MPNIFLPFLSLSGGSGSHWNGTEYMVTQKLKWQKWWDLCGITHNHFTKTYCKYHDRSRQVNAQNVTVHIIIKKFQTEFIVNFFYIKLMLIYVYWHYYQLLFVSQGALAILLFIAYKKTHQSHVMPIFILFSLFTNIWLNRKHSH